jgi:hypothetical protein
MKSRSRTSEHIDWQTYGLTDALSNVLVAGSQSTGFGLSLDDVERCLAE